MTYNIRKYILDNIFALMKDYYTFVEYQNVNREMRFIFKYPTNKYYNFDVVNLISGVGEIIKLSDSTMILTLNVTDYRFPYSTSRKQIENGDKLLLDTFELKSPFELVYNLITGINNDFKGKERIINNNTKSLTVETLTKDITTYNNNFNDANINLDKNELSISYDLDYSLMESLYHLTNGKIDFVYKGMKELFEMYGYQCDIIYYYVTEDSEQLTFPGDTMRHLVDDNGKKSCTVSITKKYNYNIEKLLSMMETKESFDLVKSMLAVNPLDFDENA